MLRNEGDRLVRVVVSTPKVEYFRVSDPKSHNIQQVADWKKAVKQHDNLKRLLEKSGCEVIDVPELRNHPNSVFTRDTSLITPQGYIKLRMGLPTRRGEEGWMTKALDSLGEPCAGSIESAGTVEGGDVILAGEVAFVGRSLRTNQSGTRQLSRLLAAKGYEVRKIILPPAHLHLGGVMSMIGPKSVLCCRGVFADGFFDGLERIEVPVITSTSGNVICLGDREVIADNTNIEAIKELKRAGVKVHLVNLSEFIKGSGGPTCLILPIERR